MSRKLSLTLIMCLALTGLAWASAYSDMIVADAPLSYFRFEDASAADTAVAADTMGLTTAVYRNRGTDVAPMALVPGIDGQAAQFNGTANTNGNFVLINDTGYTGDVLTNATMTLELWINSTGQGSYPTAVNYHDSTNGPELKFDGGGLMQPFVTVAGSTWYAWPPDILNDGQWHHYVATFAYDSGTSTTNAEIFMDAQSKGTYAFAGQILPNTTDIWKGIYLGAGGNEYYLFNGFIGLMDEVAIYDYVLSGEQILAHSVPEPMTLVLLGLGGLLLRRRK